ncbi:MAG: DUF4347 domain-containing protein [Proteobacteria bacterium]|nr:DUF4347 domain-containing protein [Pseudomonadota bacterium]
MKLKVPFASRKSKPASAPLKAQALGARLYLQPLEPRVLLDAAAARTAQEAAHAPAPEPAAQAPDNHAALVDALSAVQQDRAAPQAPAAEAAHTQVYFIDRQVSDAQGLAQSLPPGAEIHFIERNVDGVQFIAQTLQGRTNIDAVHILSHGEVGEVELGTARLSALSMLQTYKDTLKQIGQSLSADADILLYGCDFAAGPAGLSAVQVLAQLTGADVAASSNNTGAARFGGDWALEVHQGSIETAAVQAPQWDNLMAPPVVDLDSAGAGTGSTASYSEGDAPVAIAPTASVTDADGGNMASMTVRITNGQAGDVLSIGGTPPAGITSNYNPTTFTLTLTGAADAATYQAALQAIRYNADTQNPGSTARNIDVTVNDGTATSTVATAVVAVTPVNDLPAVDLNSGTTAGANRVVNGTFGGTTGNTNGWTVTGTGRGPLNTGFYSFSSTAFVSISQSITGWDQGTADSGAARLSFTYRWNNFAGNPAGTATLEVSVGGVLYARFTGSPDAGTNATVEYFNGASGPAGPFVVVPTTHNINIDLPNGVASTGDLTFTYRSPGTSGDPMDISGVTVNALPTDATPGTGFTNTYTENGPRTPISDTDVTITDADNTNLVSATVVLTNAQAGDNLGYLGGPAGINFAFDTSQPGRVVLTLTGNATLATYMAAIRAVTFGSVSESPSTIPRNITVSVNDGVSDSAVAISTINVVAANDAPVLADTALTMTQSEDPGPPVGAVGSLVSTLVGGVTDPDVGDAQGIAVTVPLATATAVPTLTALPSMALSAWPAFSKLSLAFTLITTGVSSGVVTASSTASGTGVTFIFTVAWIVVVPSLTEITKLSAPLKSPVGV